MNVTLPEINKFLDDLAGKFDLAANSDENRIVPFYPASENLLPLVLLLVAKFENASLAEHPSEATVLLMRDTDPDIVSWQSTIQEYDLVLELVWGDKHTLPWEVPHDFVPFNQKMLEEVTYDLLTYLPDDETREGLRETPKRVAKAWAKWTSGYNVDVPSLLKVFKDGAEDADQMVLVRDIPVYSKCEHHLADIIGWADVAYIPNGKVVGLSKLSRVVDAFARRLQVQERMTNQIADALWDNLNPKGAAVRVRARHMCMESRGVCQQGHHTVTVALRGAFLEEHKTREEFMLAINSPIGV